MGRGAGVPGRERLTELDDAGEGVVLGVGAGRTVGVDDPADGGAGLDRVALAAAVGEAEHVVELLVDALRLPLAVDGASPFGDGVVVAVALVDAALEPLAQRHDQPGRERLPHRRQRAASARDRAPPLPPTDNDPASAASIELGGDGVHVTLGLLGRGGHERVERAHRLPAAQGVEDLVLLVGEHPLELAGTGDDQRDERGIAPLERRLGRRRRRRPRRSTAGRLVRPPGGRGVGDHRRQR